jgi:rod shape-determining protein MreB
MDLGTANTLVSIRGEGVVLDEPTVAALDRHGVVTAVGLDAKRMLGRTPDGVRALRPMKDGVIADFLVAEQLIRRFLTLALARGLFRTRPVVVIAVPSCITEVERRAVRDAAESAGVNRLRMVAEPLAAAIGAGLPIEQASGSMVVDLGGGTTDVAIIALSGIVCDTSIRVGGDELDTAIVHYIRRQHNMLIGESTAEFIKLTIGSALPRAGEAPCTIKGRDLVSGLPRTAEVDPASIREAIREPLEQVVNAVRRALEQVPPELASDLIERGITLTGGGALLPGLDQLLAMETGLLVQVTPDPLRCVARGVERILDDLDRYEAILLA